MRKVAKDSKKGGVVAKYYRDTAQENVQWIKML